MTLTLLHAVARKAEAITPDADLLARFTRDHDNPAFEELVRRHGPLVWAVCRHMLPDHADAEDAFQAVFLALVRSAASIRDGRTVPAWLHGVAVRIATRAKRAFARRSRRERRAAVPEADRPVSDGAWEAMIAAVHEEVQRLPDAERTAFVLCDLEGVSQPDAAARLGWPLGSLSGRLCRARQRLLERLSARGIAPAAAAGIGATAGVAGAVPANLFDAVKVFPGAPGAASTAVAVLARGLTEGMTMHVKLMAATTVMVAALGLTGGAVLLSKADAQPGGGFGAPPGQPVAPPAGSGGGRPGGGNSVGPGGMPPAVAGGGPAMGGGIGWTVGSPKWEYKFVAGGFPAKEFVQLFTDMGNDGWEFCGYWEIAANQLAEAVKAHPDKMVVRPGSLTTLIFKRQKATGAVGGMGGPGGPVDPDARLTRTSPMGPMGPGGPGGPAGLGSGSGGPLGPAMGLGYGTGYGTGYGGGSGGPLGPAMGPGPGGPKPEAVFNVFVLKQAKSEEMVTVLQKLFPNGTLTADPRTNSIILRGDGKTLEELKALLDKLDVPVPKAK